MTTPNNPSVEEMKKFVMKTWPFAWSRKWGGHQHLESGWYIHEDLNNPGVAGTGDTEESAWLNAFHRLSITSKWPDAKIHWRKGNGSVIFDGWYVDSLKSDWCGLVCDTEERAWEQAYEQQISVYCVPEEKGVEGSDCMCDDIGSDLCSEHRSTKYIDCVRCGCAVADKAAHEKWHEMIQSILFKNASYGGNL